MHNAQVPEMNANLKAAIAYSQMLGWHIFPIHYKSKTPITQHGFKDATNNIDQIKQWWSDYPNGNIGVPTGAINGFFVLDVDTKRDKGGFVIKNGFETLESLTDQYGELPGTVMQLSGSKEGHHYLFKYHEGITNDTDMLPGLDIRGEGGYIVVSPSLHPDGNKYEWELSSRPEANEIAEAPKWLLDFIPKPENQEHVKKPSSYWNNLIQGVSEGGRNQAAAALAGHLFRHYVDPGLVVEIMHLWNERNSPPLEVKELDTVINSIASKELTRRRGG